MTTITLTTDIGVGDGLVNTFLLGPIAASYDHKQAGDLVAVVDGENYIEVAIINGNAAQKLAAGVGDSVEVSGED